MPDRRLRFPARAGVQLPAGAGRHLRLPQPDPALRLAHRRHRFGSGAAAEEEGRTLSRPDQARGGELRAPGRGAAEDLLRQSDPAVPGGAAPVGSLRRPVVPGDRPGDADGQGSARADRGAAAYRQDDAPAVAGAIDRHEPPGSRPVRPADRRASRGSDRHGAVGARRGRLVHLRRARFAAHPRSPRW